MSSEERRKILQMVEEGRISADEAASLMRALNEDEDSDEAEIEVIETGSGSGYESDASSGSRRSEAPEFDQVKARARRFALIPLWVGVVVTVLSAWSIYAIQQNFGANFWFYFLILPLMLGVLLITLGAGGRSSRWIYIDVDRRKAKDGDGPRHITLGFPLPLGVVSWFLQTFGHNISGLEKTNVDGIIQMMEAARDSTEPLIINVDDSDDGEHVQIYIG